MIYLIFFSLDEKETKNQDGKIAHTHATRHRLPSILTRDFIILFCTILFTSVNRTPGNTERRVSQPS